MDEEVFCRTCGDELVGGQHLGEADHQPDAVQVTRSEGRVRLTRVEAPADDPREVQAQ